MNESICGLDCKNCPDNNICGGCSATKGKPFKKPCIIASCCIDKGLGSCDSCSDKCLIKERLIAEFNALGIEDMEKVTKLNSLKGSFVNLEYKLASGQTAKLLDDNKIYLGNQVCKRNSNRCYGLAADENYLLVCEYGNEGADAEIVVFKRRR